MRDPRKLSNQAEAELDELRRVGVKPTDADVVLINALCWEIESPQNRQTLSRGKPVQVGGAWLWPRTIAACAWFEDVGCSISDGTAALAYCMAHGRDEIETAQEAGRSKVVSAAEMHERRSLSPLALSYCRKKNRTNCHEIKTRTHLRLVNSF